MNVLVKGGRPGLNQNLRQALVALHNENPVLYIFRSSLNVKNVLNV
jgi:hypothetical protein